MSYFTNIVGAIMLGGGLFNAGRKLNELEKWKGYTLGLAISLFADGLLIFAGIGFIIVL